ncbi:2640_t:CDS:2 [Funneliformis geosporum]|nr:2640_t:CDS:2 [Funneliformis geosporum]
MFAQFKVYESCSRNQEGIHSALSQLELKLHTGIRIREGVKTGGYIDDFWVKFDMKRKMNRKDAEVSARICEIQADNHLLMNERSKNVLNETIKEHNKASESLSDFASVEYNARKRRKQNHQLDGYTSPSPLSPTLRNSLPKLTDNPFFEEEEDEADDIIAINDISRELYFEREDSNESIWIARNGGLLVESHIHEILSLFSILMLAPDSYLTVMIDLFGLPLLDQIHKELMPTQQIILDPTYESTFRKAIKMANKLCDDATNWLYTQLANEKTLKDNAGFAILDCLKTLHTSKIRSEHSKITHITNYLDRIMREFFNNLNQHVIQWPNTALDKSKARAKWDSLDSAIDKDADIKIIGAQCINLIHGMYTMVHFGQVTFSASIKEMSAFVDEIETLLRIQEIFYESFNILYAKLYIPSPPSNKVTFKKDTLCTPQFRKLVNKMQDCYRSFPFWFERF